MPKYNAGKHDSTPKGPVVKNPKPDVMEQREKGKPASAAHMGKHMSTLHDTGCK